MQASVVGTKLILGALLLSSAAWSQKIQALATTGTRDDSGLTWAAPQSVYASRPVSPITKQVWIMTDTDCAGTASATPTQCRWSGSAWQATGGSSGSGTSAVLTNVNSGTFTATPSYSVSTSTIQVFNMPTLTGNVTSQTMTTTSATAGQTIQWVYLQDGTGGRTVAHPANLLNACAPDLGVGSLTIISAVWEGTNAKAFGCGTTANGFFLPPLAFSSYPTCGASTKGMFGVVTDSSTTNISATVTGSGSGNIAMFCNGTNWIVYGGTTFPTLNQNTSGTAANLSGTPALPNGVAATSQSAGDNSTKLATTAYVDAAAAIGRRWWCASPGLGDGLNAIAAGTYLQSNCYNLTGNTVTLTSVKCFTDNSGTSTCSATNGAGTALLTGAITATSSFAAGTQSGTTTIASGDYIKITLVADGTSKQFSMVFGGTY